MKKNTALKALCKVLLSSRKLIYIQRADGYTYISDGVVLIRIRAEIDDAALKESTGINATAQYTCNHQQLRAMWEHHKPRPETMPAEILPVCYIYHVGRAERAVQYIRTYSGDALAAANISRRSSGRLLMISRRDARPAPFVLPPPTDGTRSS